MRERVSKRILGFVSAIVGLTMAMLDGFGWFNANEIITIGVFSFSAALLGIDTYNRFKSNQE
jgi:hypothetical protein